MPFAPKTDPVILFGCNDVENQHYSERIGTLLRTVQRQAARLAAKERLEPSLSNAIGEHLRSLNAETLRTGMPEFAALLGQMKLSVFVTDEEAGFVTGGEPCFVCVPGERHPFLGHPNVEVTPPLSPRHLAFCSWKAPSTMDYSKLDRVKVDEVHSRTIAGCRKEFVSTSRTLLASQHDHAFGTGSRVQFPVERSQGQTAPLSDFQISCLV